MPTKADARADPGAAVSLGKATAADNILISTASKDERLRPPHVAQKIVETRLDIVLGALIDDPEAQTALCRIADAHLDLLRRDVS